MNKRQKLVQQQFLNNEEEVIGRLDDIYGQALNDVTNKIGHLEFTIGKLQEEYDWLDDDDPRKAKIKSQIQSKIYQKKYQEQLQKQLDGILNQMHASVFTSVSDYLDTCYSDGFIGSIFDLHGQGIPIVAPIDQKAMVRAVQLDSKISKGLYTRLGEDVDLLKKKITAQVSRGISTGMSFQQVAQQLSGCTRIGYNNAVRIARTEGHRIQTTAAMDAMHGAKDKGCDVVKQWDATLDDRTRESHVAVDGQIKELDKPFSNGLDFPGDPSGGAAEVVNCRCAILQRARWALDEDELETLKERAKYYDLDKAEQFDDFKKKYLKAASDSGSPITTKSKVSDIADKEAFKQWFTETNGSGHYRFDDIFEEYSNDGKTVDELLERLVAGKSEGVRGKFKEQLVNNLDEFNKKTSAVRDVIDRKNTTYSLGKQSTDRHSVETYAEWKKAIEKETGTTISDEQVKKMLDSTYDYTHTEYLDVIAANQNFGGNSTNYASIMSDAQKKAAKEKAEAIEELLRVSPKYEGDAIYRGLGFSAGGDYDIGDYDRFMSTLEEGNVIKMDTFSSWTGSKSVAKQFAATKSGFDDSADTFAEVIMVLDKPKSGVRIADLAEKSVQYQDEVLMPKAANYKIKKITKKTSHYGDTEISYIEVLVEEVLNG